MKTLQAEVWKITCSYGQDLPKAGQENLKESTIDLKDNESEAICALSAQAELLKDFYSSIFREDDERPALTLPDPMVIIPVRQFPTPIVRRKLSSLDILKGAGPDATRPHMIRWLAFGLE